MSWRWVPSCVRKWRQHWRISCCTASSFWPGQFSSFSFPGARPWGSDHGPCRHEPENRALFLPSVGQWHQGWHSRGRRSWTLCWGVAHWRRRRPHRRPQQRRSSGRAPGGNSPPGSSWMIRERTIAFWYNRDWTLFLAGGNSWRQASLPQKKMITPDTLWTWLLVGSSFCTQKLSLLQLETVKITLLIFRTLIWMPLSCFVNWIKNLECYTFYTQYFLCFPNTKKSGQLFLTRSS